MKYFTDKIDIEIPESWVILDNGSIEIPAKFTRYGVFEYSFGNVLRPPEEVFKKESLDSILYKPLTIDHPNEAVTIDNWGELTKGIIKDAFIDGDLIRGTLLVWDKNTIEILKTKKQLSMGYFADYVEEPGVFNNIKYDYKQKNIKYNHVSVVEQARAGADITVDSLEKKEDKVSENKEKEFTIDKYEAKIQVLEKRIEELTTDKKELEAALEKYQVSELKQKIEKLGMSFSLDGKDAQSIKREVVNKFLSLDSNKIYSKEFIDGAFDSIIELQNKKIVNSLDKATSNQEVEVIDIKI
jgi:hypothetical protein